jgi:hypothetical protein
MTQHSEEFSNFDAGVRKILSVSRDELKRREEAWKLARAAQKPRGRRPKNSDASRASVAKD